VTARHVLSVHHLAKPIGFTLALTNRGHLASSRPDRQACKPVVGHPAVDQGGHGCRQPGTHRPQARGRLALGLEGGLQVRGCW
jgi:hypothetical protein